MKKDLGLGHRPALRQRPSSRAFRAGSLAVAVAAFATAECARKGAINEPPPVLPGNVSVEANRLSWPTDQPARGSVRYGFAPGAFDHQAYPYAAGRIDRSVRTEHEVALLDVRPGQRVYSQVVNEVDGQPPVYSETGSFVAQAGPTRPLLVSTMIHIGFGDSHLLTMPNSGKRFLIDSGGRCAGPSVITYLQDHGIATLDAMLATHVHEDHLGGVVGHGRPFECTDPASVLQTFPPAVFFDSPVKSSASLNKPAYRELLDGLPPSTQRVVLSRHDSSANQPALALDPEVQILVLNSGTPPGYVAVGHEGTDINNESIVLRFTYGDVDFVIGGDCEFGCENSIMAAFSPAALEVEYFKTTHHGLPDANGSGWVSVLLPRIGFIPNTRQVWNPPSEFEGAIGSTVDKLRGVRAHVYVIDDASTLGRPRFDSMGRYDGRQYNTSFVTDGRSYEVRVELATQPTSALTAQESGCLDVHDHVHDHAQHGRAEH